jgi:UDP-glucose 4-epimerase
MRIAVVGGSGFLGSHVADVLADRGHEVVVIDRIASPHVTPSQRMVVADLLDAPAIRAAVEGCAAIYQFAGLADLDEAASQPVATVEQNVLGTAILLDAAVAAGARRVIYASTIYVHGRLGGFYRCSKQAAELYVEEYQRRYGLDYTILRYGTLYGPRTDGRNSVRRYLEQALTDGRIVYPGTGEEVREYVHVRDAAELSADILDDRYRNQPLLITGQHRMPAREMLAMIREILRDEVTIEYAGSGDPSHYALTPYAYTPKVGRKLVSNCYVDMGQGLLECLEEIGRARAAADEPRRADGGTLGAPTSRRARRAARATQPARTARAGERAKR